MFETRSKAFRVLLVAVATPKQSLLQTEEYLDELAELATTMGWEVVARTKQYLEGPKIKTYVGTGKLGEIQACVAAQNIQLVLFDDSLSPSQARNLSEMLDTKVMDRSSLILEIFAMRAQTAQAKLQVELARQEYLLPRLTRMWTHLSRQKGGGGGGAGMQGTGEKELETDRRMSKKRIQQLKEKLKTIEKQGEVQKKKRERWVRVALVGYTNAGKSTLMQALSRADVLVEDKLFATLTTTVRKVVTKNIPFLLSDTVGFIRKLPHELVASFKSTLNEACEADFLLHMVDVSNPAYPKHIEAVQNTLEEIGAQHIPTLLIANKCDATTPEKCWQALPEAYSKALGKNNRDGRRNRTASIILAGGNSKACSTL